MADTYEVPYLVIHGPRSNAIERGAPNDSRTVGWGYTSHNGNPAFCMYLIVTDFYRQPDNSIGFTITYAALRKLPSQGYFGYPFTVYASLLVNGSVRSKVSLFSKPSGVLTWSDQSYKMSGTKTLTAAKFGNGDTCEIRISILSQCTCAQSGVDTPVFEADFTQYIPPATPYIWRRFGTSQTNDPDGYAIDPTLLDGNWHLTKPVYLMKEYTDGGTTKRAWFNVEDPDTPVYGPNGQRLDI